MEYGTKIRLLYLYQYLLEHTDSDHPQSTSELKKMLKDDYDLKVSRNTISNDLAILRESDLHIEYIESTQNKYFYNGRPFEVSELTWDGDYYYVRGFCYERQAMRTFRLDRIKAQPVILHEIAVASPDNYNPEEYHKAVFRMYDTDEPKEVSLFCHVSAMKYLIDNFGQSFWSEPVDEEHFRAKVRVCTSTTFYRWIFGFTGRIRIEGPEETVEEYREQIRSAAKENGVL